MDNLTERLIWLHRDHPERKSLDWALGLVQGKRALILDIGANCGAFTIPLVAAAGAGSRCLSFEPNPVMAARLETNLRLNNLRARVEVQPFALGATPGEATLFFAGNLLGEASLRSFADRESQHVTVPVRCLSDYLTDVEGYETIFLKIDVEGYEPEVLSPFFATAAHAIWPHYVLIETEHRLNWSSDLGSEMAQRGYVTVLEREGNSFLMLQTV
jgi:FkbM family methyltransferase